MNLIAEIEQHALEEFPSECVGYVVKGKYYKLVNISNHPTERYQLSTKDKMRLFTLGVELDALVHSHPVLDNTPSTTDISAHKSCGFGFWIIGTDGTSTTEIREMVYEPTNN